jgi:hypothetical protein
METIVENRGPMRENAAASESLKLAFHEQGGATLVLTSIELPEESIAETKALSPRRPTRHNI